MDLIRRSCWLTVSIDYESESRTSWRLPRNSSVRARRVPDGVVIKGKQRGVRGNAISRPTRQGAAILLVAGDKQTTGNAGIGRRFREPNIYTRSIWQSG